jgi:hypothetical protein
MGGAHKGENNPKAKLRECDVPSHPLAFQFLGMMRVACSLSLSVACGLRQLKRWVRSYLSANIFTSNQGR